MKIQTYVACLLCSVLGTSGLRSQEGQGGAQEELRRLRQEFKQYKEETDEAFEELENRVLAASQAGGTETNKFLITGYGFTGFTDKETEASSFGSGFNPIFLWKHGERLFFEAELEVELEGADETEVALEFAQLSYTINDYVTLSAGKFLNPTNYFIERLHPLWINKLADKPLPFGSSKIHASSQLGVQLRGGSPAGQFKVEYALFAGNGPRLETDATKANVGSLKLKNFEDNNNNKTIGGRFGVFPVPEAEIGYGVEFGKADAAGTSDTDADFVIHSVDFNYVRDVEALSGTIDVRFQWVWSDVDTLTYDPGGTNLVFENDRSGGYAQLACRPAMLENEILKNLEAVVRVDQLDLPAGAPTAVDEQRVTFGLNYWLSSSTVAKIAYQLDDRDDPAGAAQDENAFFIQFAMGF